MSVAKVGLRIPGPQAAEHPSGHSYEPPRTAAVPQSRQRGTGRLPGQRDGVAGLALRTSAYPALHLTACLIPLWSLP